jgi:hypothetical protein
VKKLDDFKHRGDAAAGRDTPVPQRLAHTLLDRLPALNRRRLLASYSDLVSFKLPLFKTSA